MLKWTIIVIAAMVVLVGAAFLAGSLIPQSHVARGEATIDRPVSDVYATIADVAHYGEWRRDVRAVQVLGGSPLRWTEDGEHGTITFQVEETAPPGRFVVRIADPDLPFGGRWIYELTPTPAGGTRVVIVEEGEVYNPLFRLLSRVVFSQTATIDTYLRHLSSRLSQ